MTESFERFDCHIAEGRLCIDYYSLVEEEHILRYVWIVSISSFDLYLTELISEVGLKLLAHDPPILTENIRRIEIPLGDTIDLDSLSPANRLIFFKNKIFAALQFKSFYRPDKISEALSYIWRCPPREKWARIHSEMQKTGRYIGKTEQNIREELSLIGNRRDLIAHSVDLPPGAERQNAVTLSDAQATLDFVYDLAKAIDLETERQLP